MSVEPLSRSRTVALAVSLEGSLGVAAWLVGWLVGVSPVETLAWDEVAVFWGLAAILPMLVLFGVTLRSHWRPLRRARRRILPLIRAAFQECTLYDLTLISTAAGFGEELLFRGLIQGGLVSWLGPIGALLAASIVFGLAHAITATYALLVTLVGVYLGGIWWLSGNLLTVIVAHAAYDLVALAWVLKLLPKA